MRIDPFWLAVGLLGQAFFFLRFLLQWLASERRRESVVPPAFWHLSVAGGVALVAYSIHRGDPVFIVGETFCLLIFVRNLWLIRGHDASVGAGGEEIP